jgi:hypothetical protein
VNNQTPPRCWKLKAALVALGALVIHAVVFVNLSQPTVGNIAARLRPGQTRGEMREILKDMGLTEIPTNDGPFQLLFDGDELVCTLKMENDRVLEVEVQIDNGPFWERTRRALERRWRALERILRGQKQPAHLWTMATQS